MNAPIRISIAPPPKPSYVFAHSYYDIYPVLLGFAHFAFQISLFFLFPHLSWWLLIPLGFLYAYMIAWQIESVAHNFTHNPYFKSKIANRLFSLMLSLSIGFSQQFYRTVHVRHHIGNSDRPDENGNTRDWFSIYRYGKGGEAESVWTYSLFGFFRGDNAVAFAEMGRGGRDGDVRWSQFEHVAYVLWFALGFIWNWKFMVYFLPFYYLGHVGSMMVGYYEHYQANPDLPIAWGVSTYGKWYNRLWMNNGYHAEHHYRPKLHWTQMKELQRQIASQQKEYGVYVIKMQHMFGFLQRRPKTGIIRA